MPPTPRSLRRSLWLIGALLLFPATMPAAWKLDPDFRPLPGFGFVESGNVVQLDGKVLVNRGLRRLHADGSLDTSYTPADDGRLRVQVSPQGQLISVHVDYTGVSNFTLTWLNADGTPTATKFNHPLVGPLRVRFGPGGEVYWMDYTHLKRLTADGVPDPTFDIGTGVNNSALMLHFWPTDDGKVIIAGTFPNFSGYQVDDVVRLHPDGVVDTTYGVYGFNLPPLFLDFRLDAFAPLLGASYLRADKGVLRRIGRENRVAFELARATHADGTVALIDTIVPLAGNQILITGDFARINGVPRARIARLHVDGAVDTTFDAGPAGAFVLPASADSPPTVYPDGRIQLGLRLLASGAIDPSFVAPTPAPALIQTIAPTSDQRLVVGGRFTHVDGLVRAGVAVLNADGTAYAPFAPTTGPNDAVETVAVQADGRILAGGAFTMVQGRTRVGVARFNTDGTIDESFNANLNEGAVVHAIAVHDSGAILLGGRFSTVGGTARANLAALLPGGGIDPSFAVNTGITGNDAEIRHIGKLPNGQWLVAGYFDAWNGTRRWSVARLNANGSLDTTFDPANATSGFAANAAGLNPAGGIVLGGRNASSPSQATVLALESTGAAGYSRALAGAADVTAVLAEPDGSVFLGTNANSLLQLHPNGAFDVSFAPDFAAGGVHALAFDSAGGFLVGGDFLEFDGLAYASLGRLIADTPGPRMANLSTRGRAGSGSESLIAGFFVAGDAPQRVMLRGVAKALEQFGVTNLATDVSISVYRQGESSPFASNALWTTPRDEGFSGADTLSRVAERVGAFPLIQNSGSSVQAADAAMLLELPPGGYTFHVTPATPGIALAEVYDVNGVGAERRMVNISTRARVGTGDERLIAGFVIDRGSQRVLIRAVGPAIASLVSGTLADPVITLVRQSDQVTIATNDNWGDASNAAEIASVTPQVSGLQLASGSADAALLVDLPAGAYTAIVSGAGDSTGIALVEAYEIP